MEHQVNNGFEKANQVSLDFFSRLITANSDEHTTVGYSKVSHLRRYHKMLEIGDLREKTILDIGCGLGGFYSFLKEQDIDVNYWGIDINPAMIKLARERNPEIAERFEVFDIISNDHHKKFDYVIAIGILNLKFDDGVNYELTNSLMQQMAKHAKIGFAVSMTSNLSRKPSPDTFYFDATEIIRQTLPLTTRYKLDHSYLPNDFTIFGYMTDFFGNQ
jgi:2-polyprenyl-3-methyl-5-hydroxy-6-metoxy-1,4-benzoquinol methylase